MASRRRPSSGEEERRRGEGEGVELSRKEIPVAGVGGGISDGGGGLAPWFFASDGRVWLLCLIFRVANALLVQTYFNPDEHWQALEVAHRVAFG